MTTVVCSRCGIEYGMPEHFYWSRQKDKREFFCPNGHSQAFITSLEDNLRREKDDLECKMQAQINEVKHAQLVAEKERDRAIKDKRRVERRIAHGVCPCCNKTFADLSNHMVTEHKEFRLPAGKARKEITGPVQ